MSSDQLKLQISGLIASLGILLFVIGMQLVLTATGAVPSSTTLSTLRQVLFSPDDGILVVGMAAVDTRGAWAVMAMSLAVETITKLRGARAPRLPAWPCHRSLRARSSRSPRCCSRGIRHRPCARARHGTSRRTGGDERTRGDGTTGRLTAANDDAGPIELPERTAEIVIEKGWSTNRRRPSNWR